MHAIHPNFYKSREAQARAIAALRAEMNAQGIVEVHPLTKGLTPEQYQINLKLWVLVHNGPKYFDLPMNEQAFHRQFSNWATRNKNRYSNIS